MSLFATTFPCTATFLQKLHWVEHPTCVTSDHVFLAGAHDFICIQLPCVHVVRTQVMQTISFWALCRTSAMHVHVLWKKLYNHVYKVIIIPVRQEYRTIVLSYEYNVDRNGLNRAWGTTCRSQVLMCLFNEYSCYQAVFCVIIMCCILLLYLCRCSPGCSIPSKPLVVCSPLLFLNTVRALCLERFYCRDPWRTVHARGLALQRSLDCAFVLLLFFCFRQYPSPVPPQQRTVQQ